MTVVTAMPKDLIASMFKRHTMPGAKLAYCFICKVNDDKLEKGKRKNINRNPDKVAIPLVFWVRIRTNLDR